MKTKLYKIRNKETGEFSKGETDSRHIWTKGGKTWTNIGHMKNHIHQFLHYYDKNFDSYPYKNAEIVEVEVDLDECFSYDVNIMVEELNSKEKEKQAKAYELHRVWVENREKRTLNDLLDKYGMKGVLK